MRSREIGSPNFETELTKLAKDPRVVGIRGFLWSPKLALDAKQLASVKELAAKGMTLDIISRNCLGEFADVISFFERRTFDPNILVSSAIEIGEAPAALAKWALAPGRPRRSWSACRRNEPQGVNGGRPSDKNIA